MPSREWKASCCPDRRELYLATRTASERPLCNDWDGLLRALSQRDDLVWEMERNDVHVWSRSPNPGDRCQCGARTWL
jgi:hypothetical protein